MDRRNYLTIICLGGCSTFPGCLSDNNDEDWNESVKSSSDIEMPTNSPIEDYKISPYSLVAEEQRINEDPIVLAMTSKSGAEKIVSESESDNETAVSEFIENTDFANSVLLYAQTDGPTGCHDLYLVDLKTDESTLYMSVRTKNPKKDDKEAICVQSHTTISELVRVTFSSDIPANFVINVDDSDIEAECVEE